MLSMICIGLILSGLILVVHVLRCCLPDCLPDIIGSKPVQVVFGALGFAVTLIAVIIFAVQLPKVANEQYTYSTTLQCPSNTAGCTFYGQYDIPVIGGTIVWGPSTGWIVTAVNILLWLLFLGFASMFI